MKILHFSPNYFEGMTYQENILPFKHSKLGNEVVLVTSYAKGNFEDYSPININKNDTNYIHKHVKVIYQKRKGYSFVHYYPGLLKCLEKERPDLIFVHGYDPLIDGQILLYKKRNPKCKLVVDSHSDFNTSFDIYCTDKTKFSLQYVLNPKNKYKNRNQPILKHLIKYFVFKVFFRPFVSSILSRIDRFFPVGEGCRVFAKMVLGIPDSKMSILPLGIDFDSIQYSKKEIIRNNIRNLLKIKHCDIVAIFAGKVDKDKHIESLIFAFNKINQDNFHLILVGSYSHCYKTLFEEKLQANSNIHIIGWVEGSKIQDYFFASDFAVFPGGESALWQQAMGCGLPAIYKYWIGTEYLDGGNAIFLYSSNDEELCQYIKFMLHNPKMLKTMGELAHKHAREHFDYKKIAEMSLNV